MYLYGIVCFVIQGHFTTWLDDTPVTVSNWYKPYFLNETQLNLLDIYNGEIIKRNRQRDIFTFNSLEKHYDHYDTNNCSAIAPYKIGGVYVWVDVPCNKSMNAWYVCQTSRRKPALQTSVITNETCDEGWILVEGTGKCFIVMKPQHAMSFLSAEYVCHARNSTLLSITTPSPGFTEAEYKTIFSAFSSATLFKGLHYFEDNYISPRKTYVPGFLTSEITATETATHISHSYDRQQLTNLLYGERLNENSSVYKVSNILLHNLQLREPKIVNVFANFHGGCGVIEYITISFREEINNRCLACLGGWGAKNRSCYKYIDVDFVVCEKESRHVDVTCGIGYFKCDDSSCILSAYRCDQENDCFDGTDENYCELAHTLNHNSSISDRITLPCQLNCNCSLPTATLSVYIHSICDGIYSETILVEENNICQTNVLHRINISVMQVNTHSIKSD